MAINLGSTALSNAYLGSTSVSAIYLGSTTVWTSGITTPVIKLGGWGSFTQAQLESRLTGETITFFATQSGDMYFSSSTNYTIANGAFASSTFLTSYLDNGTGGSCTSIGNNAFNFATKLADISFPSASLIGTASFQQTSISTDISASLPLITNIPTNAFRLCVSMSQASHPSVTSIGSDAFYLSGVTSANFPLVTQVGSQAFYNGVLQDANFPSLVSAGVSAFQSAKLTGSVDFTSMVTASNNCFYGSTITSSGAFPNLAVIGDSCFYFTSFITASFPNAKTIGSAAFESCNFLMHINFPSLSGSGAIGGTPLNNNVFLDVPQFGTASFPSLYQTNNAGGLDGDIDYLQNTQGWLINWL